MPAGGRIGDGQAIFVVGSRGAGKTEWTMQQTHTATRLLVWDPVQQWTKRGLVQPAYTIEALKDFVVDNIRRGGRFRVGYAGPIAIELRSGTTHKTVPLFPVFCRLAWTWLRARPGGTLVVEELADVTNPGKAPLHWGEIVRKSRHVAHSRVFGLTQRPAESDKTLAGNCDLIHCGRLSNPTDRASLAKYLDVPVSDINGLGELQWIERDNRTRALRRGMLKFQ
jgi:hypothetical protein